jgi:CHASE2 domain-containing sensor protein
LNPRLLVCLLVSALAGIGAAVLAVLGGWGPLLVLMAYMSTASSCVLATVTIRQPVEARRRPAPPQLRIPAEKPTLVRA